MKILILTTSFPRSISDTSGKFIKDQIQNLRKYYEWIDFIVLIPHDKNSKKVYISKDYKLKYFHYFFTNRFETLTTGDIKQNLQKNFFNYFLIPFFFIFQIISTYKTCRLEKPDLIYAHWFTTQAISAYVVSKLLSIPYVITSHSSDVKFLNNNIPILGKKIIKKVCLSAKSISVTSNNTRKLLESNFEIDEIQNMNINTIPMGLNSHEIDSTELEEVSINDGINILFIGRFIEIKGIEILINSFKQISENYGKINLLIAGYGQDEKKYKNMVSKLNLEDKVNFLGRVNEAQKKFLFNKVDLLVIPSITSKDGYVEGLPVVILEGMYSGTVCIASSYTNAEDIIDDGVNGFILNEVNISSLSKKIRNVLDLDAKSLDSIKKNSAERAKEFNSKNSAVQFYDNLLS